MDLTAEPNARPVPRDPRRWLLAGAGVLSTGIGAVGAIVPGLPTTIFLIIASYCFARSCPWLEQRLLRRRLFAPYMAWIDGHHRLPRRAKAGAMVAMWIAVATSLSFLWFAGQLGAWVFAGVVGAAIAGTAAIATDATARLRGRPATADRATAGDAGIS